MSRFQIWALSSAAVHFFGVEVEGLLLLLDFPNSIHWLAIWPAFQHLKQAPIFMRRVCSSVVNFPMSIAFGSLGAILWPCVTHQLFFCCPWFSPRMACAIRKLVLYWMAFEYQSWIMVGTTSPKRIFLANGGFNAFQKSPIRCRWSEALVFPNPACPTSSLNSITNSSADQFPCFIRESLFIAFPVQSAALNASLNVLRKVAKGGNVIAPVASVMESTYCSFHWRASLSVRYDKMKAIFASSVL